MKLRLFCTNASPSSTPGSSPPRGSATLNSESCILNRAPPDYLVFGGRNDPQPMGDNNSESPGTARHSRMHHGSPRGILELCFHYSSICIKAVTIITIFAILSWMIQSTNLTPWSASSTPSVADEISLPGISGSLSPQADQLQTHPPEDYLQPDDHHPHCPAISQFSKSFKFSGLTDFSLQNLIIPVRFMRVYGSIHIFPAPASQEEDIKVNFTFDSSDLTLQDFLKVEASESSLVIEFPTSQTDS